MSQDNVPVKETYMCPECSLHYESKEIMQSCEAWCSEHKSCNLEIIQHSEESKETNKKVKLI